MGVGKGRGGDKDLKQLSGDLLSKGMEKQSSSWRVEDQGEIFLVGNEVLLRVLFGGGEGRGGAGAGKARTVGKCRFPRGRVLD